MPPQRILFSDLPFELLFRILSFFSPQDTHTLRNVIIACHNTDHENVYAVAEKVLRDQQTWLLERWRKIHTKTSIPTGAPPGIELIAEQVVGKQFVTVADIIDDADHWAFKKPIWNLRKSVCA